MESSRAHGLFLKGTPLHGFINKINLNRALGLGISGSATALCFLALLLLMFFFFLKALISVIEGKNIILSLSTKKETES